MDKDDNTTNVTGIKMTKLDNKEASKHKAFQYVVDKIADHDVVNGETLYSVSWHGLQSKRRYRQTKRPPPRPLHQRLLASLKLSETLTLKLIPERLKSRKRIKKNDYLQNR